MSCRTNIGLGGMVALLVVAALLGGCQREYVAPDDILEPGARRPATVPSYNELVDRYNAHVIHLDQFWSATTVSMRWVDEDGRLQFEQGDGQLIYRRPSDVVMTVGQLGQTILWVGSDDERYWLFDLQGERTAMVGRHANVGRPCARQLAYPVSPRAMPYLMGLLPLQPSDEAEVAIDLNYYRIDPPGTGVRIWVDPATYHPLRVDLLDSQGESVVAARLHRYEPVRMETVERGQWPRIATAANIYVLEEEGYLSLSLGSLSDGRRRDQVRDAAFDFETLQRMHRPREVIELDADCD
ncbi:hypothetical protein ACERK3_02605 [Phycisphaerales bacterium AB-hyl4]|uniref:Outer membrane lipoprotein-sorting protein n=1 Tax=Natronomicrosphaera hydrolytica TaxID=3242702 RepID=A0ABV4U0P6_9BACT